MTQFFAIDWSGAPFIFFGAAHIVALLVVVLLNFFLIWRYKNAPEKVRRTVAYGMAGALMVNELNWHLWNAFTGQWTIQTMLPLHLCSVLV